MTFSKRLGITKYLEMEMMGEYIKSTHCVPTDKIRCSTRKPSLVAIAERRTIRRGRSPKEINEVVLKKVMM